MFSRSTLLLAAVTACCLPQGALSQPAESTAPAQQPALSADGKALSGLSAAQLFDIADQARAAGRFEDAEAIYKALSGDPAVQIRSEARFRLGMMLADQKRWTDSALTFRTILDEQPNATRVRLELARVLAAMGNEGQARQQLRQAQAAGLPVEVAQVVDRFAAALRSTKTFGGNFELSFAPDSNINRATSQTTLDTPIAPFVLSEDARAQSGVGARLAGQVYARLRLSPTLALVPRLSGDGTFYRKSSFNDLSGSALLGLEWQLGRDRLTPSAGATWRYYGGDLYARTATIDMRWLHPTGRRSQLTTSAAIARTSYSRNSLQDGSLYSLGVSLERALGARSGVGLTISGARQTARDRAYSTASGGLTLVGWRDLGKTTLFANSTVRRLESDAALMFGNVPLFGDRRKEWLLGATAGATLRQIQVAGFSPVLRAGYERNFSSVGIYDYRRVNVDIGITRAF